MALSDSAIKAARPQEKARKLFDGQGLYLHLAPTGGRWWRFKYRFGNKEKLLSLGTYPEVSLKRARDLRNEARELVASGVDPSAKRQAEKHSSANTFRAVVDEWLALQAGTVEAATLQRTRDRLETVARYVGSRPVNELLAADFLPALKATEHRGRIDTAHRMRAEISRVMRYAVATGRAPRDPIPDLAGALKPVKVVHFAAVTDPGKVGELLRSIDGYVGQPSTEHALKLAPLVFVRPGELRGAEWAEFDLEGNDPQWRIPAARMKMDCEHLVPLSRQAVAILKSLQPITGQGRYLFPALSATDRPISENTINSALRRLGYSSEQMTGHGFRSMASTLLNELGFHPDVIELQLAHAERNKTRAAYNRATRLLERRKMMQAWADYLDGLRAGGKIVNIAGRRSAP